MEQNYEENDTLNNLKTNLTFALCGKLKLIPNY